MLVFSLPDGRWEGDQWVETSWFDGDEVGRYDQSVPFIICPIQDVDTPPERPSSPDSDSGTSPNEEGQGVISTTKNPGQPVIDLNEIPYWLPTPDPAKRVEPDPARQLGDLASADSAIQRASAESFHLIPGSAYAVVDLDKAGPATRQAFAQFAYGKWEVLAVLPETIPFKEAELSGLPVENSRGIPKEIKLKFLPSSAASADDTVDYVSADGGYHWSRSN